MTDMNIQESSSMKREMAVMRADREGKERRTDWTAREYPLTIMLNNEQLVTLLCSPADLKALAVGFLVSEGLLSSREELSEVQVDDERGIVRITTKVRKELDRELFLKRVLTTGCGKGISFYSFADLESPVKVTSDIRLAPGEILDLSRRFQGHSEIYRSTHGVHSAALCSREDILVFAEDIGRHNAIDKIFGRCLMEDIPVADGILITSGRISSEILFKIAKRNIPVIISKSAPTDMGVQLAGTFGITLIGFVRGGRMNIYAGEERVT